MRGVHAAPQTAQGFVTGARSASIDFFASSKISGEMIGPAVGFFFILVFTIKQIGRVPTLFLLIDP